MAAGHSNKTYNFDEKHDRNIPAQIWFQNSHEGLIFFIVFYTQACRWSRCLSCNLPSLSSRFHVDYRALMAQVDWIFNNPRVIGKKKKIRKVIISNNGSVLDEETFSSTALIYLIAKLNLHFSNLSILSIETRLEYVEVEELEFLARALKEGDTPTELEFAVGFEAFDDTIRNSIFNKGLNLKKFESFVKKIAAYNFRLKCYFMQKPVPGMSDEEAINDIKNAVNYLSGIALEFNIKINIHLNPTFVAFGTALERSFKEGKYAPVNLIDVAKAALSARGKNVSLFIGLYDEGLAVKKGSFRKQGDKKLVAELERFNKTQDFDILSSILKIAI